MNELSGFSEDEIELVSAALYKIGVWVSHADDEDGEEDDEREMRALGSCVRAVAKKYDGPGLVDDVAREALKRQGQWEEWADYSFNALDECRKALAVMKAHGTSADVKNYKAALMEVAVTVAQAYGEFGQFDDEDEGGGFGALLGKITGGFSKLSGEDKDHPMNVSAAEDSALEELRTLLRDEDS